MSTPSKDIAFDAFEIPQKRRVAVSAVTMVHLLYLHALKHLKNEHDFYVAEDDDLHFDDSGNLFRIVDHGHHRGGEEKIPLPEAANEDFGITFRALKDLREFFEEVEGL